MATRQSEGRRAPGSHADQTILLARTRCTVRDLEEQLQDRDREIAHLREQHRELSLDYQHVLARLWHLNAK